MPNPFADHGLTCNPLFRSRIKDFNAVGGGGVGGGSNVVLGHLQSLANSSSSNCGSGGVNSGGGGGGGGTDHTMVAEIEEMVDRQASKN